MSINRVMVTGNLTHDAELRETNSGFQVLVFRVAVNKRTRNKETGEWSDVPNYFNAKMFGARGASLASHLKTGTKVSIDGELRWSQWQAKDGSNREKVEIVVNEIEFLSPRQSAQQAPAQRRQQPAAVPAPAAAPIAQPADDYDPTLDGYYDEDVPF